MKFSVIVPTYNRPEMLARCLTSFLALDYPAGEWELIVVNDGGENSLTAVTPQLFEQFPLHLHTIPHAGPAAARNAGARQAKGEILAFTDDDCRVAPDWLKRFEQGFMATGLDGLGGRPVYSENGRSAQAAQHLIDFLLHYLHDEKGDAMLLLSNNLAYRRSLFSEAGGFDESFPWAAAEDMEFCHRMLALGHHQQYFPDACVWHDHHLTAWEHIRQQFHYGRGAYFFMEALKKMSALQLSQPKAQAPFYSALTQSLFQQRLPLLPAMLLLLGQIAYRFGLAYQTARSQ